MHNDRWHCDNKIYLEGVSGTERNGTIVIIIGCTVVFNQSIEEEGFEKKICRLNKKARNDFSLEKDVNLIKDN